MNDAKSSAMPAPFRLGNAQLVWTGVAVLVVVPLIAIVVMKDTLQAEYVLRVEAPRLQERFGFRMDRVQIGSPGDGYGISAISSVEPDGLFARAGFRPGDVPTGYVHGLVVFYDDLERVLRGLSVTIRVTTVDDLNRESRTSRAIALTLDSAPPTNREP